MLSYRLKLGLSISFDERSILIRPYKQDDLEVVADIGNRAWCDIYRMFRETYGDELFAVMVPDEKTSKGEQVRSFCRHHPEWIFVCEEKERIVGFVTFRLDEEKKIGEIGNNAVDPECSLKGLGQQMYSAVLAHFKQRGMHFAKVQTGQDAAHAPARRAYERAGFDIAHKDVTYFRKL
jgi:ribosomal protein S18 acetylase RimI-like enzyme